MKIKLIIPLLCLLFSITGCATRSDSLGLTDNSDIFTNYSQSYKPAREALLAGNTTDIIQRFKLRFTTEDGVKLSRDEMLDLMIENDSALSMIEKGLILLNSGEFETALIFFDAAEKSIKLDEEEGFTAGDFLKSSVSVLFGTEELEDYELRSYEKVMMLNYKALCYMLLGDRKAYNVTRRAIDLQQREWEKFKAKQLELQKDIEEEKRIANNENKDTDIDVDTLSQQAKEEAKLVTSAYVNPFSDYMNGLLMELDSFEDVAIGDNASISYSKVIANNKRCKAAKEAIKDLKKSKKPRGKKLVQVLLADGFAPTRDIVTKDIEGFATVNFADPVEVPSMVESAKVIVKRKKYNFSSLSEIQAIVYRDEMDNLLYRYFMVLGQMLRSGFLYVDGEEGGGLLNKLITRLQVPDTRSWLSLPKKVQVARFFVPNKVNEITIQTFDKNSGKLASVDIALAKKGPTVVYAVSYDKSLKAYANMKSWIDE